MRRAYGVIHFKTLQTFKRLDSKAFCIGISSGKGLRMIVLVYIVYLIVLLRGFPCFHDFLHGTCTSLHPYSFR